MAVGWSRSCSSVRHNAPEKYIYTISPKLQLPSPGYLSTTRIVIILSWVMAKFFHSRSVTLNARFMSASSGFGQVCLLTKTRCFSLIRCCTMSILFFRTGYEGKFSLVELFLGWCVYMHSCYTLSYHLSAQTNRTTAAKLSILLLINVSEFLSSISNCFVNFQYSSRANFR